ncbi:MAG TPA: hypothetical protein VG520_08530 [Candidatus Dormibacteraeota bacterium]|jgi:hypothetical protein|nr:hypothetical protein [Candidatus Dormibacteraeota bacterium]
MAEEAGGVDLSGLHRELDRLKNQLCRCQHQGTCLACRGFEILREQSQTVVAASSQPVLMQVAQEAAVRDLIGQLGGVQEKLAGDPQIQELLMRMMERVQEDLGGPDELAKLFSGLGFPMAPTDGSGGPGGPGGGGEIPGFGTTAPSNPASESYDDRPHPPRAEGSGDKPEPPPDRSPPAAGGDDPSPAGA